MPNSYDCARYLAREWHETVPDEISRGHMTLVGLGYGPMIQCYAAALESKFRESLGISLPFYIYSGK